MSSLIKTTRNEFRLPRGAHWVLCDNRVLHEIAFPGTEHPPVLVQEVVAICSQDWFDYLDGQTSTIRLPSVSVNVRDPRPLWNWAGAVEVPRPEDAETRMLKAPDRFNPAWKLWIDRKTKRELLRINADFLRAEDW